MGTNNHPNRHRTTRSEADDRVAQEAVEARPILVLNPRHDGAFGGAAQTLLDHDAPSVEGLQESLRETYPNAVVRARDLSGEAIPAWYVYREGHWVNAGPRTEG